MAQKRSSLGAWTEVSLLSSFFQFDNGELPPSCMSLCLLWKSLKVYMIIGIGTVCVILEVLEGLHDDRH